MTDEPTPAFVLADFLPYQLSVASNAVSRAVAEGTGYEARFGLSAAEWRVLAATAAAGRDSAPSQAEIGAITAMDKMTISRAVAGLVQRRLVTRARDEGDRRALRLAVTGEGQRVHDLVAPRALAVEAALLAALGPGEAAALRSALARLRAACGGP